jgi:hypothetical protein
LKKRINALAHADYSQKGAWIRVRLFRAQVISSSRFITDRSFMKRVAVSDFSPRTTDETGAVGALTEMDPTVFARASSCTTFLL